MQLIFRGIYVLYYKLYVKYFKNLQKFFYLHIQLNQLVVCKLFVFTENRNNYLLCKLKVNI